MRMEEAKCPYCGATLRSAICSYCGSVIEGFSEEQTYNEYVTKKARKAKITFFNTFFPMIFAVSFGCVPLIMLGQRNMVASFGFEEMTGVFTEFMIFGGVFGLIGLVAAIIVLRSVLSAICVSALGTDYLATVCGYSKSSYTVNNNSVYSVKLLMNRDGERYYIYLDTGMVEKRYMIGSTVTVRNYNNLYKIIE